MFGSARPPSYEGAVSDSRNACSWRKTRSQLSSSLPRSFTRADGSIKDYLPSNSYSPRSFIRRRYLSPDAAIPFTDTLNNVLPSEWPFCCLCYFIGALGVVVTFARLNLMGVPR